MFNNLSLDTAYLMAQLYPYEYKGKYSVRADACSFVAGTFDDEGKRPLAVVFNFSLSKESDLRKTFTVVTERVGNELVIILTPSSRRAQNGVVRSNILIESATLGVSVVRSQGFITKPVITHRYLLNRCHLYCGEPVDYGTIAKGVLMCYSNAVLHDVQFISQMSEEVLSRGLSSSPTWWFTSETAQKTGYRGPYYDIRHFIYGRGDCRRD